MASDVATLTSLYFLSLCHCSTFQQHVVIQVGVSSAQKEVMLCLQWHPMKYVLGIHYNVGVYV